MSAKLAVGLGIETMDDDDDESVGVPWAEAIVKRAAAATADANREEIMMNVSRVREVVQTSEGKAMV